MTGTETIELGNEASINTETERTYLYVVNISTSTEGVDYVPVLELAVFHIGEVTSTTSIITERCVSVAALADEELAEANEEFSLQLVTSGNVAVALSSERGAASITIQNGMHKQVGSIICGQT